MEISLIKVLVLSIYKKSYNCSDFQRFIVANHLVNRRSDGVFVSLEFSKDGKTQTRQLKNLAAVGKLNLT